MSGANRVATPEETLERVLPLMGAMGVTRLADLTGLDRVDVPVFAAYRPNSRSLAVFQGKGATVAAAKASALMEAAETFSAERACPPLRLASLSEISTIGPGVDIDALPRRVDVRLDEDDRLLWTAAIDIVTGKSVYAPFELVHASYAAPSFDHGAFHATTNGLASGNDYAEAVAHALYETIERDAVTLWSLGDLAARAAHRLDLDSVACAQCRRLIAAFDRAQVEIAVWDVTSDIAVASFLALCADRAGAWTDPEVGSGCHPCRDVALFRALSEAAQARATFISGARDDFEARDYASSARARRLETSRDWMEGSAQTVFADAPTIERDSVRDDLIEVASRLARVGLTQILAVDLTHPALQIPVARVLVPGLEGVYGGPDYAPGRRAASLLARS